MKIGIFGVDNLSIGKENIPDPRLDKIKEMAHSAKKTYIRVEIVIDFDKLKECDGIISTKDKKTDLLLTDLEFVEKRLAQSIEDKEKGLLNRFKQQLESEKLIFELQLSEEESKNAANYGLLTSRPIYSVESQDTDKSQILSSAYGYFGYISFFTANEKEAHAWPIKKGMTCWQASGLVHSDIQKGFIRAEVISYNDLINDGSINQARSNNHQRLEDKDYIVGDGDLIKFRFNK